MLGIALAFLAGSFGVAYAQEEPTPAQPTEEPAEPVEAPVEPPAELDPPRARVAVLLLATGDLDPSVADELNELLIGGVAARGGVTILGREELQAQIGQSGGQLIECIGSMACMGRLGVQLGVGEVIAGTLTRRGDRWVFNLNRVDVRSGEIVGRVFREVEGDLGAVADSLSEALPVLYEPPVRLGTIVVECETPHAEVSLDGVVIGTGSMRHEGVPAGRHEVAITAPGHEPWRRAIDVREGAEVRLDAQLEAVPSEGPPPLMWVGLGIGIGAFAVALPLALSSMAQLDLSEEARLRVEITRADSISFYQDREAEAIAADVLFAVSGVGAILFGVAVFLPIFQAGDPGPRVAIGPGRFAIEGRF